LDSIRGFFRSNRVKAVEGWMARYIGEILMNINDQHLAEAETWMRRAIEANQKNGMFFELGRTYVAYSQWFKRKGDRLKRQENLGKAIEILKECGADGWVEKYEKELASIS
jgi:hypothetical protein